MSSEIDVPVEYLWDFLGDNRHARVWSAYFDHFIDLPPRHPAVEGHPGLGARRRCFRAPDQHGFYWDEETVAVREHRLRRIYTFNVRNHTYLWQKFSQTLESYTDNLFERLSPTRTRFTFSTTLFRFSRPTTIRLARALRLHKDIEDVFVVNQDNIKAQAEALYREQPVTVPHPYDDPDGPAPIYPVGNRRRSAPADDVLDTPGLRVDRHDELFEKYPPRYQGAQPPPLLEARLDAELPSTKP